MIKNKNQILKQQKWFIKHANTRVMRISNHKCVYNAFGVTAHPRQWSSSGMSFIAYEARRVFLKIMTKLAMVVNS